MMCNKQWPKGKLRCIPPHLNLLQKNTTAADTTYLQLLQCESPPFPNFGVVFECWASHDWSQGPFHWTGCNLGCFLETFGPSSLLLPWLVEPGLHIALPVLFKVSIGDYTVPFGSHNRLPRNRQNTVKKSSTLSSDIERLLIFFLRILYLMQIAHEQRIKLDSRTYLPKSSTNTRERSTCSQILIT